MNKIGKSLLIAVFLFSAFALNAQETMKHTKKWYTDAKGRFYFNKHLPVYFWISASPSENAPKHRLKSESTPQYSNPMYFDVEGFNTLRSPTCVDTVTKQVINGRDVWFEVYADGIAPATTAKFTGAPKYDANGKTYYGKNLKIELKAYDEVSGTEKIYYSLNGANYQEYSSPIEIDKDTPDCTLQFYAVDNVGNAETPKKVQFSVDVTPPDTKQTITGRVAKKSSLSPDAQITLTSTDKMSGVKHTYYVIDNRPPVLYTAPIPATLFTKGNHKLAFYSVDNVENNNADDNNAKTNNLKIDFVVDNQGPEVSYKVVGDQFKDNITLYVSPRSKIELIAKDELSDVAKVTYGVDAAATTNVYSNPFELKNNKGIQTIFYSAVDDIGNTTPVQTAAFFMDNNAPITGINYGRPQFFNRDTLFIRMNTNITFFMKDYESGVLKTEYSIDGATFNDYKGEFTIAQEGFHKIKFKTTDKVNNTEQEKESNVYVDNTGPEIYTNFSIKKIRDQQKDGKTYPVYPTYTKVYIGATDAHVGTETIFYSINGGPMQNYASINNISEVCMLTKEQFYTLKIVTTDKLGNQSEKTIEFFAAEK